MLDQLNFPIKNTQDCHLILQYGSNHYVIPAFPLFPNFIFVKKSILIPYSNHLNLKLHLCQLNNHMLSLESPLPKSRALGPQSFLNEIKENNTYLTTFDSLNLPPHSSVNFISPTTLDEILTVVGTINVKLASNHSENSFRTLFFTPNPTNPNKTAYTKASVSIKISVLENFKLLHTKNFENEIGKKNLVLSNSHNHDTRHFHNFNPSADFNSSTIDINGFGSFKDSSPHYSKRSVLNPSTPISLTNNIVVTNSTSVSFSFLDSGVPSSNKWIPLSSFLDINNLYFQSPANTKTPISIPLTNLIEMRFISSQSFFSKPKQLLLSFSTEYPIKKSNNNLSEFSAKSIFKLISDLDVSRSEHIGNKNLSHLMVSLNFISHSHCKDLYNYLKKIIGSASGNDQIPSAETSFLEQSGTFQGSAFSDYHFKPNSQLTPKPNPNPEFDFKEFRVSPKSFNSDNLDLISETTISSNCEHHRNSGADYAHGTSNFSSNVGILKPLDGNYTCSDSESDDGSLYDTLIIPVIGTARPINVSDMDL
ncbi:hypothetical protein AYI68_g3692 [Smittium mucronatum]|uniref:Uncharacterized protein n=1 Tax=Smittium mucronatum TaxID=133383 RepID=A0A1R0GZ49_9FUNG|nr:hypothetical protein AYI68_g3692 [Smittium mucronatum]